MQTSLEQKVEHCLAEVFHKYLLEVSLTTLYVCKGIILAMYAWNKTW